jgi:hypothetical protein
MFRSGHSLRGCVGKRHGGLRVRFGAGHAQVLTEATLVPFSSAGHVRSPDQPQPHRPVHPFFFSFRLDVQHFLIF